MAFITAAMDEIRLITGLLVFDPYSQRDGVAI